MKNKKLILFAFVGLAVFYFYEKNKKQITAPTLAISPVSGSSGYFPDVPLPVNATSKSIVDSQFNYYLNKPLSLADLHRIAI